MLSWIGVHWCSVDFNHYFGVSKCFGLSTCFGLTKKGVLNMIQKKIHGYPHRLQSSLPPNRHGPPRRWRLSISLRFAITLGRLRRMYLGSRLEKRPPWGLFGSGIPTNHLIGTPWKPKQKHHHCEPFILDDLCISPQKMGKFSGWPHEHPGIAMIGVKIVCSKCQKNTFKQPTVPTPKP